MKTENSGKMQRVTTQIPNIRPIQIAPQRCRNWNTYFHMRASWPMLQR